MADNLFETLKMLAKKYAGALPPKDLTNAGIVNRVSPQGMGGIADGPVIPSATVPGVMGIAGDSVPKQSTVPSSPNNSMFSGINQSTNTPYAIERQTSGDVPLTQTVSGTARQMAVQGAVDQGHVFTNNDTTALYGGIDAPMTPERSAQIDSYLADTERDVVRLQSERGIRDLRDVVLRAANQPTKENMAAAGIAGNVLPTALNAEAEMQAKKATLAANAEKDRRKAPDVVPIGIGDMVEDRIWNPDKQMFESVPGGKPYPRFKPGDDKPQRDRYVTGTDANGNMVLVNIDTAETKPISGVLKNVPKTGGLPERRSVPQGMTAIGKTPQGQTVYQDANGKRFVE